MPVKLVITLSKHFALLAGRVLESSDILGCSRESPVSGQEISANRQVDLYNMVTGKENRGEIGVRSLYDVYVNRKHPADTVSCSKQHWWL